MKLSRYTLLVFVVVVSAALPGSAAIPVTTSAPAVQTFDSIGTSATAPLPADFRAERVSSVRTVGTYAAGVLATQFAASSNMSPSATNGIYNFGATANANDRAIGFLSSSGGTQSGNLYMPLVNNAGGLLTGLTISYDVEKYRLGINVNGFRIQLYYSTDGLTWTSAGSDFTTSFPPDSGSNLGYASAPGVVVPVSAKTLNVSLSPGAMLYLAWNYSVSATSTATNAQALGIDNISILGIGSSGPTNPLVSGSASPATVVAGGTTVFTVNVTPGANPPSSSIAVTADLSSVGGSPSQPFAPVGGNAYTFSAAVPAATAAGAKSLPVTATDGEGRTGTTTIALNVEQPVVAVDHLVISQVFGGGGNSGAPVRNDFVELYNPTSTAVVLNGWTLQYSGASANTWGASTDTVHLSGIIEPNRYYLIGLAQGNNLDATALPTPHAWGTIPMSSSSGRVALVRNADPLSGDCPLGDPDLVDFVGYGSAICGEGNTKAPALSNTTAALRKNGGATDTENNQSDFTAGTPNPRNTTPFVDTLPTIMDIEPTQFDNEAPRDASISLMFSEDVEMIGTWFTISCATSGLHDSTTIGRSGRFRVITPNVNFTPGEQCTVTIASGGVRDLNGNAMAADFTWKFTIAPAVALAYGPEVHLAMGNPSNAVNNVNVPHNYLLVKPEYAVSYNRDRGIPNWVSWHLAPEWDGTFLRVDWFRPDPQLPVEWYRVQHADYTNSGYSRGHMTASNDRTSSRAANQATFLMTNIIPQTSQNNGGAWLDFENYLYDLTKTGQSSEAYVVAGGVGTATMIGNGRVAVPTHTWKVALILPLGSDDLSRVGAGARTIGIVIPNTTSPGSTNWMDWVVSVDQIEALTGYNFFSNVPDAVENAIEAGVNGANPPGAAGQSVSTDEDSARAIALDAAGTGPLTFTIVSAPSHGTLTGSGANVTYTPAPNYYGNDSFTFQVSDGTRTSNVAAVSIVVNPVNDIPVITAVSGPTSAMATGSTATIVAGYADPDGADTHTATFAWDDGTTSTAACAIGICTASHTFSSPGIYTVGITVTDSAGTSDATTFEHAIVYEHSNASVTGGGWIDTPSGRASFNVNAKYQKNGNMTQFKAGAFDLRATAYEWLVIAGSRAQYRGTATVNGEEGFTFLVTAYDADTDAFRIKVWNAAGAVVYDNVPGTSDDLDVADPQPLGGGSIVVH
jgi:endonuclease G, mitochondrial